MTAPTYEYTLVPVNATEAARVPLPMSHTPKQRMAFLANVPADILATAERWPLASPPADPVPPIAGERSNAV